MNCIKMPHCLFLPLCICFSLCLSLSPCLYVSSYMCNTQYENSRQLRLVRLNIEQVHDTSILIILFSPIRTTTEGARSLILAVPVASISARRVTEASNNTYESWETYFVCIKPNVGAHKTPHGEGSAKSQERFTSLELCTLLLCSSLVSLFLFQELF